MNFISLRGLILLCGLSLPLLANGAEHPDLSIWLNSVLKQHPQLQAAQAAVDAAQAQTRAAGRPLFNPELELEYEETNVKTRSLGISQTIDWGDKRSARSLIASNELRARQSDLQATRQRLAIELITTLAAFQVNVDIEQVAKKRQQLMSQFIDISKLRRLAGDLAQIELDLAQLASAEANFTLANAQANTIISRQALFGLLGVEQAQAAPPLPDFPSVPEDADYPVADLDMLLDNLPLMRAARAQMEISRAELQLRQREQRPDPTFGVQVGREGRETLTGLNISIPLYVRNNFSAEVDVANARLIQSQREANNVRRNLSAELNASALAYQVNRKAWLAWQSAGSNSLLQQGKLLGRLWRAGELSTTDYLVQLKQALDTEASAIEQHGRLWQTWAQWLAASGDIASWISTNTSTTNILQQQDEMGVPQ